MAFGTLVLRKPFLLCNGVLLAGFSVGRFDFESYLSVIAERPVAMRGALAD
jgi:hypothetical protein